MIIQIIIYIVVVLSIVSGIGSLFENLRINIRGMFNLLSFLGVVLLILVLIDYTRTTYIYNWYDLTMVIIGIAVSYMGIIKTIISLTLASR